MGHSKKGRRDTGKKKKQNQEESKTDEQFGEQEENERQSKKDDEKQIGEENGEEEDEQDDGENKETSEWYNEQNKEIEKQKEIQINIQNDQEKQKLRANHEKPKRNKEKYESTNKQNENEINQGKQMTETHNQEKEEKIEKNISKNQKHFDTQKKQEHTAEVSATKVCAKKNEDTDIGRLNDDKKNKTAQQQQPEPIKVSQTSESDIFDRLIDHFRGERSRYLRGVFLYDCCKNAYHFISHLPIQKMFFPYLENAFDNALFFAGIVPNAESKDHTSIEEFNHLMASYINRIDQTVDSTKDNGLDQLKILKGMIIQNPVFQSMHHTIIAISSKVPFLNR